MKSIKLLDSIRRNKTYFISAVFIDAAFILFLGLLSGFFFSRIEDSIFFAVKKQGLGLSGVFLEILLFVLAISLVYWLFQGTAWWLSHKSAGRNFAFADFIRKFFSRNIFFLLIFFLLMLIYYMINFIYYLNTKEVSFSVKWVDVPVVVLFVFLFYFIVIGNAYLQGNFLTAWRKMKALFIPFVFWISALAVLNYFVFFLNAVSPVLVLAVGIVLVVPVFSLMRIYFIETTREGEREGEEQ